MPKATKLKYSQENLDLAIAELQNNEQKLSDRMISLKYGIPRSTLRFHKNNPGHKTSMGPPPVLTTNEECILEDWIISSARKGFPKNRENILDTVQKFLEDNPRPNPFQNNRPGIGWWKAFLKRHPILSIRTSEGVTKASSCVSEKDIRGWFSIISQYAEEKGLNEVLSKPDRVFNADETNFQICQSSGLVVAKKGSKNVYDIEHSTAKESITALFTFSAAGDICCPFIVYPYKRLPEKICESLPEEWGIGKSDNGWMTAEVFYEFIANVFHPYLVKKSVEFPFILYVDGHKTHLNYHLSQLCTHLKIELIALYPNATRIMQPADVSAFRPLKVGWRKYLKKWQLQNQNKGITKLNFAPVLKEVLETSLRPEILINGFRACGLCPFDPNAIDYSKCLGKNPDPREEPSQDIPDTATITFETFKNIAGPTLCKTFQNGSFSTTDVHLGMIYNLWNEFKPRIVDRDIEIDTSDVPLTNRGGSTLPDSLNTNKMVIPTTKYSTVTCNLTEISDDTQMTEPEVLPETSYPSTSKSYPDVFKNDIQVECDLLETSQIHFDVQPESIQSQIQPDFLENSTAEVTISLQSPKLLKVKSSFGDYLAYPKTPIRKGKRQTERQPFAITSDGFKLALQKKNLAKENQIKEKEKKKLERELKKSEKSNKEITKIQTKGKKVQVVNKNLVKTTLNNQTQETCRNTESSTSNITTAGVQIKREMVTQAVTKNKETTEIDSLIQETNKILPDSKRITVLKEVVIKTDLCIVCKQVILKNRIDCSGCHKSLHLRCVPKSHKKNIPDDLDMMLFLCHYCYKIDDSDTDISSDCEEMYRNIQKARKDLGF